MKSANGSSPDIRWRPICVGVLVVAGVALSAIVGRAQPLSFQGRVLDNGTNFSGLGLFKFCLVNSNGTQSFWSNDGSSVGGAQPSQDVSNQVTEGLFSILLGDAANPPMTPIDSGVFSNSDIRLRAWFSDGTAGFTLLSPDERLAATGYAMIANRLPPGTINSSLLALQSVTTPALANASVTSAKLAAQSVTTAALAEGAVGENNLAAGSVTSGALAPGAVTTAAIVDGSITQAKLDFQSGYINAQNPPYNATGNGATDDTASIQNALNAAGASGGGIVFLPRGNYLIDGNLTIPAQTSLVGVWRAPSAFSQYLGTTLLAVNGAGSTSGVPFISIKGDNSTLEGVTIYYPNQITNNPPTPYPWAIQGGGGNNITIQNVLLVNPYLGIDLATYGCARHLVRGVYGQPLSVGIAVDQCYDIGRIMDIHFWPFWTGAAAIQSFQATNAVTFDLMRTDWEVIEDVFSWGYAIGARFRASANGSMNGQMSNVDFDNVDVGLQMINTQPYAVHISNLNIANAGGGTNHIAIEGVSGNANLNVSGATFWGSLRQPVSWNNSGLFTLSSGRFLSWDATLPCVEIVSGRAILQGNFFQDNIGQAIRIDATADRVMVLGNMLAGNSVLSNGPKTTSANNQP